MDPNSSWDQWGSEEELLQDEDEEDYKFKDESEEAFQPEEVISGAEL